MKTIQTISAVITLSLATFSHAENSTPQLKKSLSVLIIDITMPTCNGEANGSISVEATGGEAPYSYNWNTFPNQTNAEATNLKKGIYFVQVTDADRTVFYQSVEIVDPIEPHSKITASGPENEAVSISFSEPEEKETYTYFLNNQQIERPILSDLHPGIYELIISDISGCTVVTYIQIYEMEKDTNSTAIGAPEVSISPMYSIDFNETNSEITMIHK